MALESETGSALANNQTNSNNGDSALAARSRAFGELFLQRRQRLGLTLQEVSSFTKLHPRFLRAIEQADFSKLPGGILTKSFIRAYAQEIGIDDAQAVSEYLAITGQAPPEPVLDPTAMNVRSRVSNTEDHVSRSSGRLLSISLIVLLVIVASSSSFLLGRHYRHYKELLLSHAQDSRAATTTPAVDTQISTKASVETSPPTTASPVTTASIQGSPTEPTASASTQQSDQDLTPKTNEMSPTECAASSICVQINARENAWVSISVDGKVIMQNTLVAPTRKLIAAQRHVVIRAGNVGALDFRFNGVQLPAQGDYDEAKTLSFNPNGLESRTTAPNPTPQTD